MCIFAEWPAGFLNLNSFLLMSLSIHSTVKQNIDKINSTKFDLFTLCAFLQNGLLDFYHATGLFIVLHICDLFKCTSVRLLLIREANSMNPDQTEQFYLGIFCFHYRLPKVYKQIRKQMTKSHD